MASVDAAAALRQALRSASASAAASIGGAAAREDRRAGALDAPLSRSRRHRWRRAGVCSWMQVAERVRAERRRPSRPRRAAGRARSPAPRCRRAAPRRSSRRSATSVVSPTMASTSATRHRALVADIEEELFELAAAREAVAAEASPREAPAPPARSRARPPSAAAWMKRGEAGAFELVGRERGGGGRRLEGLAEWARRRAARRPRRQPGGSGGRSRSG